MFLCLVLLLFAVMTWLVIYPGEFLTETLKLYNFQDVQFKFLLVAVAALNFFLCFVIEVSRDLLSSRVMRTRYSNKDTSLCSPGFMGCGSDRSHLLITPLY